MAMAQRFVNYSRTLGEFMKRLSVPFFWIISAFLSSVVLTCCAQIKPQPTAAIEGSAPKFVLSAKGLPESGIWKCTPVLADINRDGHLDILAINRLGDGPHLWLGDGKGNWQDSSVGLARNQGDSCGGGMAYGDLNKDGLLDIAVADHCTGVYVYLQMPDGSWQAVVEKLFPILDKNLVPEHDEQFRAFFIGAEDIAVGDINEDGCLDIVAPSSDQGGFGVYHGDCTGKNWKHVTGTGLPNLDNPEPEDEDNAGWANRVILADINQDGHLDVLASYYKGPRVWLGDGQGNFRGASTGLPEPQIGGLYRGLSFGDINEDGLQDMVAANDANVPELYLQQPDGTWKYVSDLMPSMQSGAKGIALGDFTGSGHLDVLVAGRKEMARGNHYGLYFIEGDGKGNFRELTNTDLPPKGLSVTWGVAVGDINEDGRLDLIASTGGVVTGPQPTAKKPRKPAKGKEGKQELPVIPELPLPRMQVWLNQGVK